MVKPIYTPKTLKGLSDITKGSENSLLNLVTIKWIKFLKNLEFLSSLD
jgi:hypothetical protein